MTQNQFDNPGTRKYLAQMFRAGVTANVVSKQFGCHYSTILRQWATMGLRRKEGRFLRPKRPTIEQINYKTPTRESIEEVPISKPYSEYLRERGLKLHGRLPDAEPRANSHNILSNFLFTRKIVPELNDLNDYESPPLKELREKRRLGGSDKSCDR